MESALLNSFESEVRSVLGPTFGKLGVKAQQLMKNVQDIKRLIWTLLNSDCVQFYSSLADLRTFESINVSEFSIFKMCDNDTNRLIITLAKLAKERIYKVVPRAHSADDEAGEEQKAGSAKQLKRKASGMQKGSLLEKHYGKLNHNSFYLNKWLQFADKCCSKQWRLTRIETEMDLDVEFEINPKLQALVEILDGLKNSSSKANSKNKRLKPGQKAPTDQPILTESPMPSVSAGSPVAPSSPD